MWIKQFIKIKKKNQKKLRLVPWKTFQLEVEWGWVEVNCFWICFVASVVLLLLIFKFRLNLSTFKFSFYLFHVNIFFFLKIYNERYLKFESKTKFYEINITRFRVVNKIKLLTLTLKNHYYYYYLLLLFFKKILYFHFPRWSCSEPLSHNWISAQLKNMYQLLYCNELYI
jgi:hypothetical protein